MTQEEEKQLLIQNICTMLPYGLKVEVCVKDKDIKSVDCVKYDTVGTYIRLIDDENFSIKPYLRPLSSMTEEEAKICMSKQSVIFDFKDNKLYANNYHSLDYLNSIHVDYRGMISIGLALEAPEGMYN